MAKFGLYVTKDNLDGYKGYNLLKHDSKIVSLTEINSKKDFGICVQGNTTKLNSVPIINSIPTIGIHTKNDNPYINDVSLVSNIPIDVDGITYTRLLNKDIPPGYKKLNKESDYCISNNVLGDNEENYNTFLKMQCPIVTPRPYTTRIYKGNKVTLNFYVDTFYMDGFVKDEYKDTFTIIIEDENDQLLYKNTQYAGEKTIVVGPFNDAGEHWCSVRVIDLDGCSSPTVFFDFLVEEYKEKKFYTMTLLDCGEYGITTGDLLSLYYALEEDENIFIELKDLDTKAYRNKLGISKLCFDKKVEGYDGVILLENTLFDLAQFRNISTSPNKANYANPTGDVEPAVGKFFKVKAREENGEYYYTEVIELTWKLLEDVCWEHLWKDVYPKAYNSYINNRPMVYPNGSDASSCDLMINNLPKAKILVHTGSDFPIVGEKVGSSFSPEKGLIDGYNYLVNNRYGSSGTYTINIPSNFTLDMNNSTFRVYDPTNSCNSKGFMVYLIGNIDSHIKNGNLVCNYDTFNFHLGVLLANGDPFYIKGGGGAFAEGLGSFALCACKYCSLENLNISHTLGYEGTVQGTTNGLLTSGKAVTYECRDDNLEEPSWDKYYNYLHKKYHHEIIVNFNNTSNRYVDFNGNVKNTIELFEGHEDDISETLHNVNDIFYMGTSELYNITNKDGTSLNKNLSGISAQMHYGASNILFIALYDSNGNFIKLIKTRKWANIKYPKNTAKFRVIVYGKPGDFDDDDYSKGGCWPNGLVKLKSTLAGLNNEIIGVNWNHSRTSVLHPHYNEGLILKNCTWKNIASHNTGYSDISFYKVTWLWADFEEGELFINRITFLDSEILPSDPGYEDARHGLGCKNPYTINIIRCKNISTNTNYQNVSCGIIKNSIIDSLGDGRVRNCVNPHKIIKNSKIVSDKIFNKDCHLDYGDAYMRDVSVELSKKRKHAFNKFKLIRTIPIKDCEFKHPPIYNYLNLRRVRNNRRIVD